MFFIVQNIFKSSTFVQPSEETVNKTVNLSDGPAVEVKKKITADDILQVHVTSEANKLEQKVNEKKVEKVKNVAKEKEAGEAITKLKHTPPPECHGERKEIDPAAAEEYKAKKHTRPTKAQKTTVPKVTESTKRATKRHGVKFDANGDSVWVDDSNDSPDSSDVRAKKKEGRLDADGNMIDTENQASGDRNEESEEESEESDGIPLITIPLVDILNKYARMMGGKRASNSRYEYSYEDENEIKIKEIKNRILDEASEGDDE